MSRNCLPPDAGGGATAVRNDTFARWPKAKRTLKDASDRRRGGADQERVGANVENRLPQS